MKKAKIIDDVDPGIGAISEISKYWKKARDAQKNGTTPNPKWEKFENKLEEVCPELCTNWKNGEDEDEAVYTLTDVNAKRTLYHIMDLFEELEESD